MSQGPYTSRVLFITRQPKGTDQSVVDPFHSFQMLEISGYKENSKL